MAALGIGNVDLELNGETVTLKPTLRAAQALSRQSGGIGEAISRVGKLDMDTIVSVIALGSGKSGTKAVEDISEKVFAAGLASFVEPVVRYLVVLANGGRPPANEESPDTENPPGS